MTAEAAPDSAVVEVRIRGAVEVAPDGVVVEARSRVVAEAAHAGGGCGGP